MEDGKQSGTTGEGKRLEAIKIQLTGADKDKYDIYYRVHAQSYGWLGWAKNGAPSGTAGYAKRLEGIQIVVVKKGESAPGTNFKGVNVTKQLASYIAKAGSSPVVGNPATSNTNPSVVGENAINVAYRTHVQSFGWQGWKYNGQMSGTSGLAKRLEGINIKLTNQTYSGSIVYTTHVQSYGWQGNENDPNTWKRNGVMSGTSGEAKRLEAIRIALTGEMAEHYDVYYRVHAQSFGWLGWAKNGETAGTSGFAKRLEAIQIYVVPKGMTPSSGTSAVSYVQYGKAASKSDQPGLINYATHVQTYGNQQFVSDGSFSGTYGEAKRLEAIRIQVNNDALGVDGGVTYHTHVQKLGWQPWVSDGVVSGTTGQAKRLEAIEIKLTGELAEKYDVYYRVHAQTFGWLNWAKNGQTAGTVGYAKRLEGIQIVLVPKGGKAPSATPLNDGRASIIK